MSLKTMTVSKLKGLRHEVEAAIRAKVTERRHEIQTELSKLSQFEAAKPAKVVRAWTKGMVAVKVGKKLDESLGADSPKPLTPKQPRQLKRTRKASKLRKAAKSADTGLSSPATANNVEALPIEPPSAASMNANVVPVDMSAAA
jgi:hypothetical protein